MNERARRAFRRCGVWIVALVGHALLFLLLARVAGPPDRESVAPGQPLVLMLDLARPVSAPPAPADAPRNVRIPVKQPVVRFRLDDEAVPNSSITEPVQVTDAPVDWANEARLAARAATDRSSKPSTRDFDAPVKPARSKCEKRASSFEWNPEPKRAGFAGVLPYVRLGRCVVGLGFFGCPIGDPPEPNSHLFDDMKDPDRATSSVPDVDRCD